MTDGTHAFQRLNEIARASAGDVGVTRLPWTSAHKQAVAHITAWMQDAGLTVRMDDAGTLCGHSPNPTGKPVLLIGSHQDSVPKGGAFDGIMGVALGCLVAGRLQDRLADYPFAIEVLAFADEEGVRFPTALIGPRALAGTFDPATLDMVDRDGISMGAAMAAFGVDPAGIPAVARQAADVFGYIEAHIEQGPVLEDRALPVAAVSAICGISRQEVRLFGETGHAGTVPMAGRRDALVGAAEAICAINNAARQLGDLRATVGDIAVRPGAVNAIPADVRFPVEIRAPDDASRQGFETQAAQMIQDIAARLNLGVEITQTYVQPAAVCAPHLTKALCDGIDALGIAPHQMPSGATHDASPMADLCPIAMLFVRCRGGVSHRPDEYASAEDMDIAIAALTNAIRILAGDPPA